MTDQLRVILEIGKKRKVVAGAMDWPGLDRCGTSEDDALAKLSSYLPPYAAIAERPAHPGISVVRKPRVSRGSPSARRGHSARGQTR